MRRRTKPAKPKVEAKPSAAHKSPQDEDSKVRDLEKRLAEALKDKAEALGQQTATGDILSVISRSQTDVQPVFDTIVQSAVRLCDGVFGGVFRVEGDMLHLVADHNFTPDAREVYRQVFPVALTPNTRRNQVSARAVIDRAVINVSDILAEPGMGLSQRLSEALRFRAILSVPMLRDGIPIGAITVSRGSVGLFSEKHVNLLKTFADQAVIAIENVRLFKELEARNHDLTETLQQQTATGEILNVIASSATDIQPVFAAVAASANRLCDALDATIFQIAGERLRVAVHNGPIASHPVGEGPSLTGTPSGRAVLDRRTIHIADTQAEFDEYPEGSAHARRLGFRTVLAVPFMREGVAVGVINLRRTEARLFTERQVALLQTFADQAVIAIENVRLFTELQEKNRALTEAHDRVSEALEQQTATSEILRVISQSPTDTQPVFDAIVERALRLSEATVGAVATFDGELIHVVASNLRPDSPILRVFPMRPSRTGSLAARTVFERQIIHVPDALAEPEYNVSQQAAESGYRSVLSVPMLRDGTVVGTIIVGRSQAGRYLDRQIALLQTFADQAVIAIENVRLFKELETRNRDLTEALEQQTATAEILRVISQSPTDVQPVFDTIVRNAVRLCGALQGGVYRLDGELVHSVAHDGYTPEQLQQWRATWPKPVTAPNMSCQAIKTRSPVRIRDFEAAPELALYTPETVANLRARGSRSGLAVPMFRQNEVIGAIGLAHREVDAFSDTHLELLKTFADQAVIAIENVRLFKELEARTGELTQSVEQLMALGEVSRAVSSTLDVETVLDTIVSRASQLAGAAGCSIYEYDEGAEQFELRATHNDDTEFVEALRAARLRKGEGLMGRAAEMREPIQIPDITQPGAYQSGVRDTLIRFGYRALLSVPLLLEDQIIGSLSFNRKTPGEFSPEVVDVLKTFASQSALAIQNARLFREIADKSRQLEVASQHKSEFLANMSHELRTPLNAIIGFSEVLAQGMFGEINEKQTEYLHDILESGRHLLSLINDILDLSKIEAGRMELEPADFDLPSAIENALILVRERASRRGIRLSSTVDPRLGMIGGDERKVKQVLLNLLSNALKFTPEGGQIDVAARLHDDRAEVSVADTGIGIALMDQDTVFEEFRQVGTADKKAEGTGLGLTLSRKFIELHGGKIWVQSEVGRGSTFTFTLPVSPWLAS